MEEVTNLFSQYVQDFVEVEYTHPDTNRFVFHIPAKHEWVSRLFGVAEGMCIMYNTLKKIPFTQQAMIEDHYCEEDECYIITFKEN